MRIFLSLAIVLINLIWATPYSHSECPTIEKEEYELTIIPNTGEYQMKLGETVGFSAIGVKKDGTGKIISEIISTDVFWVFSYQHLEKVGGEENNIKIKGIRPGSCILKATGTINNERFTKEISIHIKQ